MITAHGRKRRTVNIATDFVNLCNFFTQKKSVLHFGTDLRGYSIFRILAERLFFAYSDANIKV